MLIQCNCVTENCDHVPGFEFLQSRADAVFVKPNTFVNSYFAVDERCAEPVAFHISPFVLHYPTKMGFERQAQEL